MLLLRGVAVHEVYLVQALVGQLKELLSFHGASTIKEVKVAVGRDSCVVEDSFLFIFDAIKREHKYLADARLSLVKGDGRDLMLLQVEMESES